MGSHNAINSPVTQDEGLQLLCQRQHCHHLLTERSTTGRRSDGTSSIVDRAPNPNHGFTQMVKMESNTRSNPLLKTGLV